METREYYPGLMLLTATIMGKSNVFLSSQRDNERKQLFSRVHEHLTFKLLNQTKL